MSVLIDILSWAALLGGSFFYVVGAIGLNRMPDVFTRMHAVSISESLGVGLLILGMLLQALSPLPGLLLQPDINWHAVAPVLVVAGKLIIIMVVLMWTGSAATHALARAALHDGEKPLLADKSGRLVKTDPVSLFPELAVRLVSPVASETVEEGPAAAHTGRGEPRT